MFFLDLVFKQKMNVAISIAGAFLIGLAIEASNPNSDTLAYGFIGLAVIAILWKYNDYRMIWNHLNDKKFPMRWSVIINFAIHIVIFASLFLAQQQLTGNDSYILTHPTNRAMDSIYHTTDVFAQVGSGGSSPNRILSKAISTAQLLDAYTMAVLAAALLIVPLVKR